MIVYLLEAVYEEGTKTVKAFCSQQSAERLKNRCQDHHKRKPIIPSKDDDDLDWQLWQHSHDEWVQGHPTKEYCDAHNFLVKPLEVEE